MNKSEFIDIMNQKIKLIRVESEYSQEQMAAILSISKKTLVEIEKGRSSLGFCGAVAAALLFEDGSIVENTFGGDVAESIKSVAFMHYEHKYPKTMGGKIWWRDIEAKGMYRVQQNFISQHYRIVNEQSMRICSSFDIEYIEHRLEDLSGIL